VPKGKLAQSQKVYTKSFTTPQKCNEEKFSSELSPISNRAPYKKFIVHGPKLKM